MDDLAKRAAAAHKAHTALVVTDDEYQEMLAAGANEWAEFDATLIALGYWPDGTPLPVPVTVRTAVPA